VRSTVLITSPVYGNTTTTSGDTSLPTTDSTPTSADHTSTTGSTAKPTTSPTLLQNDAAKVGGGELSMVIALAWLFGVGVV
jgi:hypothetical protein